MTGLTVVAQCPCEWRGSWFYLLSRLTHRPVMHRCDLLQGHPGSCMCRCGARLKRLVPAGEAL